MPELQIARVDLNDSVYHFTIADRLVDRVAAGQAALDFWMPEWSFGYPVVRDYQPLAHWLVALTHFATLRAIPVEVVFAFVRWLLLAGFPLSAYAGCRMMSLRPLTAAAVALLSPLVAASSLYGIDYGSYIWRGSGLFTQLVAMHLFVLAVGAGCQAVRNGRRVTLAGLLLGLTFLSHFIYGYMAAATFVLIAALPGIEASVRRRFVRLTWTALVSLAVSAFQIVPMLSDGPFINRSHWEPAWKWDSFGLEKVLSLTASGELLDAARLPVLSLLALAGALAVIRRRSEAGDQRFAWLFALSGALLWIFLFCGRAAWGPLFTVLGLSEAAQLHRFVGGVQWFLLILAGIGLTRLWEMPYRFRWQFPAVAAAALTLLLLWPAIAERRHFLKEGFAWGYENLNAHATHRTAIDEVTTAAARAGGRAYPGLAAGWGRQLRVGYVPLYAFLSKAHVPAVAFLYHSMALPADIMVRFDETRPEQYRLFDIRSVIADTGRVLPAFLQPASTHGAFTVYKTPANGSAFDLVQAPSIHHIDRRTFFNVNQAWLQSSWPAARTHLLLDYESSVPLLPRPRAGTLTALAQPPAARPCGTIVSSGSAGSETHRAQLDVTGEQCVALFKMTYHPKWRATVDGASRDTVMLSPGFIGIPVERGRHAIELRYDGGITKAALLLLSFPLLFASFAFEKKGLLMRAEGRVEGVEVRWSATRTYALLTLLLVLPCVAPYVQPAQPTGHDATQYLPRMVEFHENIRHGNLLPRWAPDLSSGQGQPLFLVNPPLFYYTAELFYLTGFSFIGAMNAACVMLILASAASMFLLGRWYFGAAGGAIAALAYVWAPYFLVDLYVRSAFAEFSSFPFYPIAIYGFARHASGGRLKHLVIGAAAYAAIWFAHSPAALLFSPFLGAFILYLAWSARSVRLLFTHSGALLLAILLATTIWLPSLSAARDTHSERLTTGPLAYSNHYVAPAQFFSSKWGYGLSVPGDQDGMPFSLGWPLMLLGGLALLESMRSGSERTKHMLMFFAGAVVVQCFLMTQRAHGVWDSIEQLQYIAFPWRLLASTTFILALLAGASALAIARLPQRWQKVALAAAIALLVGTGLRHAKPQSYLSLDEKLWTPRNIAARAVIASTFETFEPRWVKTRPTPATAVVVTRGTASTAILQRKPTHLVASVQAGTVADLELPVAYFPGWQVLVDGVEQRVDQPNAMGRMQVSVTAGAHVIDASFRRTPARWLADLTSTAALLVMLLTLYFDRNRGERIPAPEAPPRSDASTPRQRARRARRH